MKSTNIRYIPGLDHIRAFAAILIILYHGLQLLSLIPLFRAENIYSNWIFTLNPLKALIVEGHTAVSLFMVLSGFVFSIGAYGKEILYWPFMKNRFLRIYPLFIVLLLVGLSGFPSRYSLLSILQTLLFQSNFPGSVSIDPFSGLFWAVAVEFQFYFIFPFLHRFIEKDGIKWALGLIILATFLRYAATLGESNPRDISYWFITGRIDQFVIGMIAARWYHQTREKVLPHITLLVAATIVALSVIVGFNQLGGFPSIEMWKIFWPTVEGATWAFFVFCYLPIAERLPQLIATPLAFVGSLSYSIYLLHFIFLRLAPRWVTYTFSSHLNLNAELYTLIVVIPPLLVISTLSYYVIEKPFLNLRVKYLK